MYFCTNKTLLFVFFKEKLKKINWKITEIGRVAKVRGV